MYILPAHAKLVAEYAAKIQAFKPLYDQVDQALKIPWWLIGCIDSLEGDFNHTTYLGNGDPLNHKTVHDPAGRGPFATWSLGAIDAMKDALRAQAISTFDPSLGFCLAFLEYYNGAGYLNMGKNSPYLWSFSNLYSKGKFVEVKSSSGGYVSHYDSNLVSDQVGAACIIKQLGIFK